MLEEFRDMDYKELVQNNKFKELLKSEDRSILDEALTILVFQLAEAGLLDKEEDPEEKAMTEYIQQLPKTCQPEDWVYSKARLNNLFFEGELSQEMQPIATEGRGREKLTVKARILEDEILGLKFSNGNITAYDREVHDAIVSLYVDGGNRYITPLMVYRVMTGNPKAKLTKANFKDIVESIDKLSTIRVHIDSTGELKGKGYNIDNPILKENILYTRSVTGIYNGKQGEWIEILDIPVLYLYADSKNQVARMKINLLNTPLNKNREKIVLQGYLKKRILDMKGSNISRNILYESIYEHLELTASSPGGLRKKEHRIREDVKTILNFWSENNFIESYKENSGSRGSKRDVTIIL